MEQLPTEIVSHIFSFLPIADRFRLRRVSHRYKVITEGQLKGVPRVSSHRRDVYSPLHGCQFRDIDICPAAFKPECIISILKYCTSIECLYIGEFRHWGPADGQWSDELFKKVVKLMHRSGKLECVSWIDLNMRLPSSLVKRLHHLYCPMIELVSCTPSEGVAGRYEIELYDFNSWVETTQKTDYTEVISVNGDHLFFERTSAMCGAGIFRMHMRSAAGTRPLQPQRVRLTRSGSAAVKAGPVLPDHPDVLPVRFEFRGLFIEKRLRFRMKYQPR